jgi:hypothetical protein
MKRNLVVLSLAAVLTVTAGLAYAGGATAMRITVPFEFYIDNQLLPAGEYDFRMGSGTYPTASIVTVRTSDGTGLRIMLTRPETEAGSDLSYLQFNRYGEKRFLSCVSIGAYKANLKMLTLEKELRSQNQQFRTVALIAQK